jgi:acetoin utilization deacetylase AcuC-like enzyme
MSGRLVQVISDLRFQEHRGPDGHPERPERLAAVGEIIDAFGEHITLSPPRLAEAHEILRVHDRRLFDALESTRGQPLGKIDTDTYYSPLSYDTARLAAGSCVDLFSNVLGGKASSGLAAVRPPGHHAEADRSMGFCLFNNVAIATRALQSDGGSPRILIYDWDVHHGNGTQHIFESDPDVLYLSTHQFPFYPGTGDFDELGTERGQGSTINVPMPAGSGDEEFIGVLQRIVVPAAIAFEPDLIVISCGFDAHRDDPLASMELSKSGYRTMSRIMRSLADTLCSGRIVFVLEGGYSLDGVREGTEAVLETLTAPDPQPHPTHPVIELEPGSALFSVVDRVADVHGRRIAGLGAA